MLIAYQSVQGQHLKVPIFKSGDRVCFVGNSITQSGDFHHNISLYYATSFPERFIYFFNCGISGDVTQGILNRLESDILVKNPNYVIIMIGMNDVIRSLYSKANPSVHDKEKQAAITIYKKNLDSVIRAFNAKRIKVILQKPSIHDQTARFQTFNNYGVNDALKICGDYMEDLAKKYKLPIVDYWTLMTKVNNDLQLKDSAATIVGPDRSIQAALVIC